MPIFAHGTAAREKVNALEDYMLLSAFAEGALFTEKDRVEDLLQGVEEKWENVRGTSWHLGQSSRLTEAQLERERREDNEELWRERRDLKTRVRRIQEEIGRMERETKRCSRAYTFLTGG